MLERIARGFFGGLWVFPGGGLDPVDHTELARRAVTVPDDADDLPWRSAALRETVEEVGLALMDPPPSDPVVGTGASIFEAVVGLGAVLDGRRLRLLSQWVTPEWAPTRFDTRFYLAVLESDYLLVAQPEEVIDVAWVRPIDALAHGRAGEWPMVTPTLHHLLWLARYDSVDSIWEAAGRAAGERGEPVIEDDGSEVRVCLPAAAKLP